MSGFVEGPGHTGLVLRIGMFLGFLGKLLEEIRDDHRRNHHEDMSETTVEEIISEFDKLVVSYIYKKD